MYQAETAPRHIRGALVSTYQLFITFGILVAYLINFGTERIISPASWRITIGIGYIPPTLMAVGIMFLPESPRWDYRRGNVDKARKCVAAAYGVPLNHREVAREMREIKEKFDAESAPGVQHPWYEVLTGPRMRYRTLLGVSLQILQQLTGKCYNLQSCRILTNMS
jgi:SP family sugar:H+ symporter-like MFS transporter